MNRPYFVKLNVYHKDFDNEVNVVLNLKKEVTSIHISEITEKSIWNNEGKVKDYYSNIKCFKRAQIGLKDICNKNVLETKIKLFDFLKSAKGIFYIEFLNKEKNTIIFYSSPGIPFDDDDAKKIYSVSRNHRGIFQIYIGKWQSNQMEEE